MNRIKLSQRVSIAIVLTLGLLLIYRPMTASAADEEGRDERPARLIRMAVEYPGVEVPLGDDVIVCPAHGAGSACGGSIADRIWTTIGLERKLNPKLQFTDRDAFIANVAKKLEKPPYFERAEKWNLDGAPLLGALPAPTPLTPEAFAKKAVEAAVYFMIEDIKRINSVSPHKFTVEYDNRTQDYGYDNQIGFGQSFEEYLNDIKTVFENVYKITKDTGS